MGRPERLEKLDPVGIGARGGGAAVEGREVFEELVVLDAWAEKEEE